jgi:hypothetical protein
VMAGLLFRHPGNHKVITFILEVAGAALIVGMVSGGRNRMRR